MSLEKMIKEINKNLNHASASNKDEVNVMREFLNDTSYKVSIYNKDGKCGEYCPAESFKSMLTNIVSNTTKITKDEAKIMVDKYEATKSDAETMISLSKEFINTYLETGRKINLGCRAKSNIGIIKKENKAFTRYYPKNTGIDANGKPIYTKGESKVPAYNSIKVFGSCPEHLKK